MNPSTWRICITWIFIVQIILGPIVLAFSIFSLVFNYQTRLQTYAINSSVLSGCITPSAICFVRLLSLRVVHLRAVLAVNVPCSIWWIVIMGYGAKQLSGINCRGLYVDSDECWPPKGNRAFITVYGLAVAAFLATISVVGLIIFGWRNCITDLFTPPEAHGQFWVLLLGRKSDTSAFRVRQQAAETMSAYVDGKPELTGSEHDAESGERRGRGRGTDAGVLPTSPVAAVVPPQQFWQRGVQYEVRAVEAAVEAAAGATVAAEMPSGQGKPAELPTKEPSGEVSAPTSAGTPAVSSKRDE